MDLEPHVVHLAERCEDSTLRTTPGGECMCQIVVVLLPWRLNHHITIEPTLINQIKGLSMQGPDPQYFYPGKTGDHDLAQKIKETYGDVEKDT
jgi:hypothetical protein